MLGLSVGFLTPQSCRDGEDFIVVVSDALAR